ncbi:RING-H2 finger protein ATL52-like [Alnus glutinosa]|uniref:RING-H2 finger protein ATL52-like n=1 Tax=Alnus glutinosa TaxID=3517 RepID=UPI002D7A3418|nr:RING-H2 finger protein ATL52-like [Alnus glutinosa]
MDGMASESKPSGSFYTPLLISLAGIVATSLAIAAYHLILVRFCLSRGRRNRHLQPAEMFTGVARKVLDKIPILSYSTGNVSGDQMFREDQSECAVCIGELEDGEMVRLLPNCRHAFHVTCIDKWFLAHSNCPICRSPVADAAPTTFAIAKPLPDAVDQGLQVPQRLTSLKRSFSMGQSYIIVNIQGEGEKAFSASSSSSSCSIEDGLMQSGSQRVQSVRQLDRMSLRLLRSFSQLRLGRGGGCTAKGILPY